MRVKVCHMTSVHSSFDQRIFYKECSTLARLGYETTLVACGDSRIENGVCIIGVGSVPNSRLKRIFLFSKKVYKKALDIDADIYHLHDPELLPYVKKLKRIGKKVIFDSHENTLEQMYEKSWIPKFLRKLVGMAYRRYATKVLKKADAIISVTPHIVNMLKAINSNTYMVTNYPILQNRVEASGKDETLLTLCFTGGISRNWCHETIISCIENLSDCKYVLCGKADESYLNSLQSLLGWEKVVYLGQVSNAKALAAQSESDIGMALLAPSKNTNGMQGTIGNTKIFEYMMAGIPIVCTDFLLWREIVDKYKCGICVAPNDAAMLAKTLSYLRENPKVATEMGNNGRLAVEKQYNWDSQAEILQNLYSNLEAKK